MWISFIAANIPTDIQYQCNINGRSLSVVTNGSHFTCDQLNFSSVKPYEPRNGGILSFTFSVFINFKLNGSNMF